MNEVTLELNPHMALNPQLFCQQIEEKRNAKKIWTAKQVFFTHEAIEIAVSVNRCTTQVSLC